MKSLLAELNMRYFNSANRYEYYKDHEMSRLALAILKRAVKRLEKCILQQERDFGMRK